MSSEPKLPIAVKSNTAITPSTVVDTGYNLSNDLHVMLNYAVKKGIILPNTLTKTDGQVSMSIDNYNLLAEAIKPATPQAIQYIRNNIVGLEDEKKWYQIPIFSKSLILAAAALLILIVISMSPIVNEENQARGLLFSSGWVLLANLTFICSASLLGVMFYLLKTISDKIRNYTMLPVDNIEINSTILIGLISGFIIAELFSFVGESLGGSIEIHKMTLALLGGFSSDAMFSILQGLVNKFKMVLMPGSNS